MFLGCLVSVGPKFARLVGPVFVVVTWRVGGLLSRWGFGLLFRDVGGPGLKLLGWLGEHCNRKLPGVFGKLLPNPVGKLRRPGIYIYIYTYTYIHILLLFSFIVLSHTHIYIYIHTCISTYVHTYIFTYTCIEYYFWDRAWLVMQVHCKWVVIWPALCGSSVDP